MEILTSIDDLKAYRSALRGSVGFVPTMGALHEGHLSLIESCEKNNSHTIVSIFVNPVQFGKNEDFSRYPRNFDKDAELCRVVGVSAIFAPQAREMYPQACETLILAHSDMANCFEGKERPGHFDGVLRVLLKFFHLITPHNAYFGRKDAQQFLIVSQMVKDLFMDINITACSIVRDKNGLALSSRNVYLNEESYTEALKIPRAIESAKNLVLNGELDSRVVRDSTMSELKKINVDYCEIVDLSLQKINKIQENQSLLLIAARVGGVRLLDNVWF